jgi:crotonobetainyl-CoA:carnitine CoA-transferase CaiB-like acyl-CoA transferase
MLTRTAAEWERFLTGIQVPAARVRNLAETLDLEQIAHRGLLHRFEAAPGIARALTVPVAAFRFAQGGPRADTPPRQLGADTDHILGELGLDAAAITALRRDRVV